MAAPSYISLTASLIGLGACVWILRFPYVCGVLKISSMISGVLLWAVSGCGLGGPKSRQVGLAPQREAGERYEPPRLEPVPEPPGATSACSWPPRFQQEIGGQVPPSVPPEGQPHSIRDRENAGCCQIKKVIKSFKITNNNKRSQKKEVKIDKDN